VNLGEYYRQRACTGAEQCCANNVAIDYEEGQSLHLIGNFQLPCNHVVDSVLEREIVCRTGDQHYKNNSNA
jgi:hypothetical protein